MDTKYPKIKSKQPKISKYPQKITQKVGGWEGMRVNVDIYTRYTLCTLFTLHTLYTFDSFYTSYTFYTLCVSLPQGKRQSSKWLKGKGNTSEPGFEFH